MQTYNLNQKKIAILVTDGFEQSELAQPKQALQEAGAQTEIVSPSSGTVRGWNDGNWGLAFPVDTQLSAANVDQYDGLLLPGGVMNPDALRRNEHAVQFVRDFFRAGKPVAAICHAPWLLIEAEAVEGRTLTSYPSIATDLRNAGADWVNEEVVVDQGLVTSRSPDDMQAFIHKTLEEFAEGQHAKQREQFVEAQ